MGATDFIFIGASAVTLQSLKKSIEGISPKVLSQKLKMLERDGFISRHVQSTSPIRVEYQLTNLGREVSKTANQLKNWAEKILNKFYMHSRYMMHNKNKRVLI